MKLRLNLLIIIALAFGCNQAEKEEESKNGKSLIQYSKKLKIEEYKDYYEVKVLKPNSSDSSSLSYILYKNEKPEIKADAFIQIPIKKAVCLSTSHLPPFTALNYSDALTGFPNTKLIFNEELLQLVKEDKIQDVGRKNGVNVEKIMTLQPDLIMAYAFGSSMEQLKPLEKAGTPIILNIDYLENTPLGRAEWLKLTAVLLDQYKAGDSLFQTIEAAYLETKGLVENIEEKPTVMTGLMYGDVWYVPGGESFASKFIKDAGGDYIWSENSQTGSLELSFESVLSNAQDADYWIGAASITSLKELENTNNKYALFDAFQNQKVYSYTKRVNQNGANDYLESGFMRADLVLKDYINLLHPNILEDSTTTYFEALNP
ncbi:ABC transporter substrate-binding protein [Marivirga tractuosa]|uniref:ABC transporter substrate-binding protein n=1 Tax=Marivirga tractuosa TaxID=1006 RepID=UPI0035CEE1D7